MTESFQEKYSDLVISLDEPDRQTILIGTAHVSRSSAEQVHAIIKERNPDTVCVELCQSRLPALKDPDRWKNTDILQVIRSGKGYVLLAQLILSSFQRRLAQKFDIEAGADMRAAIKAAEEIGAVIVPVDREIKITLKRAWGNAGLWSLTKVGGSLLFSLIGGESEIKEEDVEELKKGDVLTGLVNQLGKELPEIKTALLDERDTYLARKIHASPGKNRVAVVGAGHLAGIQSKYHTPVDLASLETIPQPRIFLKLLSWVIPILVFAAVAWGFFASGQEVGQQMIYVWIFATGIFAAIGAIAALSHPLTIATAFLCAPITCLNPAIAAGWVCAIVEAVFRKPVVSDFETFANDITTWKGAYSNRIARVFLVMILVNLTASLGALVGGYKVFSLL